MSISKETTRKIEVFSKEQAKHYLKEAEQNYFDKQEGESCFIKSKIIKGIFKKKSSKQTILDAENDLQVYITDYMDELISDGLSEKEAFEQAKAEFKFSSSSSSTRTFSKDLTQKIISYINNIDLDCYLFIGLLYSAFFFLGITIGTLTGFLVGGGKAGFVSGGWVDMVIGCVIGIIVGLSLGLIAHAIALVKHK